MLIRPFLVGVILAGAIVCESPAHSFDYVVAPGGGSHEGNAIARDAAGNVYVGGQLMTSRFSQGKFYTEIFGTEVEYPANPNTELMVLKYGPNGEPLWWQSAGGLQSDSITAVRVAPNGDPIIAFTYSTNTFGGRPFPYSGKLDMGLARYSAGGRLLWVTGAGGPENERVGDLAIDSAGNVYVVGLVNGVVTFGSTSVGELHQTFAYLAKYSGSGEFLWAKSLGRGEGDYGLDIDAANNIFLTGGSRDSSFAGGSGEGLVVAKLNPDGNSIWTKIFPVAGSGGSSIVELGAEGVVVAGTSGNTLTFGNIILENASRRLRGFVVKLSAAGDPLWLQQLGGRAYEVDVAADGTIWASGFFSATSPTVAGEDHTTAGNNDAFITALSPSGALIRTYAFGGTSGDIARALTAGKDGKIYFAGDGWGDAFGIEPWNGRVFVGRLSPEPLGPAAPALNVSLTGSQLLVSWPAAETGYALEATAALSQPFSAAALQAEPVEGSPNTFRIPVTGAGLFVRIRKTE